MKFLLKMIVVKRKYKENKVKLREVLKVWKGCRIIKIKEKKKVVISKEVKFSKVNMKKMKKLRLGKVKRIERKWK